MRITESTHAWAVRGAEAAKRVGGDVSRRRGRSTQCPTPIRVKRLRTGVAVCPVCGHCTGQRSTAQNAIDAPSRVLASVAGAAGCSRRARRSVDIARTVAGRQRCVSDAPRHIAPKKTRRGAGAIGRTTWTRCDGAIGDAMRAASRVARPWITRTPDGQRAPVGPVRHGRRADARSCGRGCTRRAGGYGCSPPSLVRAAVDYDRRGTVTIGRQQVWRDRRARAARRYRSQF